MAANEQTNSSATAPWPIHSFGAPKDHFWNEDEEHLGSFLASSFLEGRDPSTSTELASFSVLDSYGQFQDAPTTPGLGLMSHNAIEYGPNSLLHYNSSRVDTLNLPNANRFVCKPCNKPFQSQSDLNRHQSSVHDKSSPYRCHVRGCRRKKGFNRKDNYEAHLRNVHKKLSKDANQVEGQSDNIIPQMNSTKESSKHFSLEGYSREELTETVMNEREKCRMEHRKRQEVEEELKILRQRHEEREDMWLKLLMAKEGGN